MVWTKWAKGLTRHLGGLLDQSQGLALTKKFRLNFEMERETRFELATLTLAT